GFSWRRNRMRADVSSSSSRKRGRRKKKGKGRFRRTGRLPAGKGKKPSGRKGNSRDRSGPGRKGTRFPEGRRRVPGEEAVRRIRRAGRRSGMFPLRGWPASVLTFWLADRPPKSP